MNGAYLIFLKLVDQQTLDDGILLANSTIPKRIGSLNFQPEHHRREIPQEAVLSLELNSIHSTDIQEHETKLLS